MINIVVPALGESIVEARVARWLKKEGDRVEVGEPVVELETEKVDLEVGADHGGILTSIKRREGEDVKVGELLAVVDDGAAAGVPAGPAAPATTAAAPATSQASASEKKPDVPAAQSASSDQQPKTTPTAKRMARDHDVKIGTLQGAAASTDRPPAEPKEPVAPAQPRPPAPTRGDRSEERVRMSKRRQTIARRLVEAQRTAAMLTTFNEIDMTALVDLRNRHKEAFKKVHGIGLGIASFFVKAVVTALKAFPQINAEIQGEEIVLKHYYDIGMAVGAEGGLVVPVLRDADRMGFVDIERSIRDFAQRAADGTLTLADLTGGTFTITNGGVFGSMLSTPILNPPQVGILGLHAIEDRPVAKNGQVVIRPMMYVALSYDHRIVDGREAVQFLVRVKEMVEDPGHLLLES